MPRAAWARAPSPGPGGAGEKEPLGPFFSPHAPQGRTVLPQGEGWGWVGHPGSVLELCAARLNRCSV